MRTTCIDILPSQPCEVETLGLLVSENFGHVMPKLGAWFL